MKNKIFLGLLVGLVLVTLIVVWGKDVNAIKQSENDLTLTMKINSDKQIYTQGEAVKLNFEVWNKTNKAVSLPYSPDVSTGYVNVWIAFSGERFNRYNNSSWGRMEGGGRTIQPGEFFKSEATVFWNSKPDVSRLNVDAIKNSKEGAILSHYAFPEAGIYRIKAILTLPNKPQTTIESEPIQFTINEPVGDDLEVWNRIKNNGEILHFIESSSFLTSKDEEKEKLLKEVEEIIEKNPNSFLGKTLVQNLDKFRTNEVRRKELIDELKQQQKN